MTFDKDFFDNLWAVLVIIFSRQMMEYWFLLTGTIAFIFYILNSFLNAFKSEKK